MFRKFVAGVFVTLFVLLMMPLSILYGVYKTVLNPDFYQEDFVDIVYDYYVSYMPSRVVVEDGAVVDEERVRDMMVNVFTKEDLQDVVDSAIEQVSSIYNGEADPDTFVIPLAFLSTRQDVFAEEIANLVVETTPACGDEVYYDGVNLQELGCIPEEVSIEDYKTEIKTALDRDFFSELPSDVPIRMGDFPVDNVRSGVAAAFAVVILLPLVLLGIVALIIFRPWYKVLQWVNKGIFITSIQVTFLSFVMLSLSWFAVFPEAQLSIYDFFIGGIAWQLLYVSLPLLIISVFASIWLNNVEKNNE